MWKDVRFRWYRSQMASADDTPLDRLYARYGFTPRKVREKDVRVYVFRQGYFLNADVVVRPNVPEVDVRAVTARLEAAEIAWTRRTFATLSEVEDQLFTGFFGATGARERLQAHYDAFVVDQTESLGGTYAYIPCPFDSGPHRAGDQTVVEHLVEAIKVPGPRLLLVEAAAGYGKTCTAYELLSSVLAAGGPEIPIFTELAKNRKASIFKYVLLDEIDRNFSLLNLELVMSEIRSGRLPVVVDGFDELLRSDSFDDAESMLATIGELLVGEAKVILTSRKTAIFAGDAFHQWLEDRSSQFEVMRVSLDVPSIADWLGEDRQRALLDSGVPLAQFANPVLLTFLRNSSDEDFAACCVDTERLVAKYFSSLLDREQDRQALPLTREEQLQVFHNLAGNMMDLDFTSESRELLRDFIRDGNRRLLVEARSRYKAADRPSLDDLADTLAGHALLDRVGRSERAVGFINDFVFGCMLGDVICARNDDEWLGPESQVDLAATAYEVRSSVKRAKLSRLLAFCLQALSPEKRLETEFRLGRGASSSYSDAFIEGVTLSDGRLPERGGRFEAVVFRRCTFHRVEIARPLLENVGFLECNFFDCSVHGEPTVGGAWTGGCTEAGGDVESALGAATLPPVEHEDGPAFDEHERQVLRQFWPIGRANASRTKAIRTLYMGTSKSARRETARAIQSLRKKGLIVLRSDYGALTPDGLREIQTNLEES